MSLGLISIILAQSCCQKETDKGFTISDKYLEGQIMIRAESQYTMGSIWIKGVFGEDESIESPRRGIVYPFDSTSFDLSETVYFKVRNEGNLQYAVDVTRQKPDSAEIYTTREYYSMIKTIALNFHNGDNHREGPFHKKRHIGPPQDPGGGVTYNSNIYVKVPLYTSQGVTTQDIYVRLNSINIITSNYTAVYLSADGEKNGNVFYSISLTHEHSNSK